MHQGADPGGARAGQVGPHVLVQLTEAINSNLDLGLVLQAVTDAGVALSGAAFGAFFYNGQDEHGRLYRLPVLSGAPPEAFATMPVPRITALFAPTFTGQGSVRVADITADPRFAGMPAGHLPVRSYLATPVLGRDGAVIGGLLFGHPQVGVFDERSEQAVRLVAAQAGVAVGNARLFEAEQAARRHAEEAAGRLEVLQRVTAALVVARTTEDVLRAVAETICGPLGADAVGVFVREGQEFRAAGGVRGPDAPPQAGGPTFAVLPATLHSPVSEAATTRAPVAFTTEAELRERYPQMTAAGTRGIEAGLALPLLAEDRVTGVLTLAWRHPRPVAPVEVHMLTSAAGQLASAMERARLYEAEQGTRAQLARSVAALTEMSRTLQRTLLPRELPPVPQVRVAVRYVPSSEEAEVGGDWYDVVPTPGGGATFVVGDVQGHNIAAAAVMGQLRMALHAYLAEGHPPEVALARANTLLAELDPDLMATCALAALDPASGLVRLVRAGHPNPVLCRAGAAAVEVAVAGGVPLGVLADATWPVTPLSLYAGDRLVLFTDGLIERPGRDLSQGVADLLAAAGAGAARSVEEAAEAILGTAGADLSDDVALLLCDFAGRTRDRRTALMEVAADLRAVGAARDFTRATLEQWQLPEVSEVATLLVSELVTNAPVHTDGSATLELRVEDTRLRLCVTDEHGGAPTPRAGGDLEATSGRGMLLVDTLAQGWGVEPHGPGKTVWAEVATD